MINMSSRTCPVGFFQKISKNFKSRKNQFSGSRVVTRFVDLPLLFYFFFYVGGAGRDERTTGRQDDIGIETTILE